MNKRRGHGMGLAAPCGWLASQWRALLCFWLLACAHSPTPAPDPVSPPQPWAEETLLTLVPMEAERILWVNLRALQKSPWTREAFREAAQAVDAEGAVDRAFLQEVERMAFASLPSFGEGATLLVAEGKFQRKTVLGLLSRTGEPENRSFYRDVEILTEKDQAVALWGERVILAGPMVVVRSAIDCAFKKSRAVDSESWLTHLREQLYAEEQPTPLGQTAVLYLRLTPDTRRQIKEAVGEGDTLDTAAFRLELGDAFSLHGLGIARSEREAKDLVARLQHQLLRLADRPLVVLLGLKPIVASVPITSTAKSVLANLRISPTERGAISKRITTLSQILARLRAQKKSQEKAPP